MNNRDYVDAKVVNGTKKSNISVLIFKILLVIFLIGVGAGGMYLVMRNYSSTTVVNKLEKEVTVNEQGIADAVEKIYDSVVVVKNYKKDALNATGTGFIFKKDNDNYYIMTNYHVIDGASAIKIVLTDDSEFDVELVGGDKYADIAVLEITSKNDYVVAEIGNNTASRVGDTVFAVGAPLDSNTYSWTVTRGILSGKDRMVEVSTTNSSTSSDYIMKVLQTDAAINSGNSGGPLCNSNGQVIGVTNMKLVSSGVEGMGFAIPIEDAIDFAMKIINGEDITRPYLGISMIDVQDTTRVAYYRLSIPSDVTYGVYIYEVVAKSSASQAGLREGDIILELDGIKIKSLAELKYQLYTHNVGDKISVKINRNGKEKVIEVTLLGD